MSVERQFDLSSTHFFNETLIKSPFRIRELAINRSLNTDISLSGGVVFVEGKMSAFDNREDVGRDFEHVIVKVQVQ